MCASLIRLLRLFGTMLISYGEIFYFIPCPYDMEPAPGHPERMDRDQPLTEAEKALARQLEGMEGVTGRG